jgi:hypothetical protein
MEARSRWPSIIIEKTLAYFKRVAEQTGILTKEPYYPPQPPQVSRSLRAA